MYTELKSDKLDKLIGINRSSNVNISVNVNNQDLIFMSSDQLVVIKTVVGGYLNGKVLNTV